MDAPPAAVVIPEAVPLDLETAGLGSRFLGLVIDWAIQGTVLFVLLVILGVGRFGWVGTTLVLLLVFLVIWGYPIALETLWRGRTVGKAALGLRVVTKEGGQIGFRHAAVRTALGLVDFILTSGAVAVICVLVTPLNQRLGDLAAGTIVLRERTGMRRPTPTTFAAPTGLDDYTDSLDLAGLGAEEYGLVRAFLLRAPSLPPAVRARLAAQVAGTIAPLVQPPPPPGVPAEVFLGSVAAAYRKRGS
ncbi:MAG: RDD family protein [Acidimicrobiia bacterium]|nr:RDD family protein [Acidimicrobiia bacterium]